jgi:hypothetical protein
MDFKCQFCSKIFSSNSNLKAHIKNAKYCIKIRGSVIKNYVCSFCNKELSAKHSLDSHLAICNIKKDVEIDNLKNEINNLKDQVKEKNILEISNNDLKKQIKELQEQIERLATVAINRPTHINQNNQNRINNIINNLNPITDDHLREQSKYLTLDHIKNGVNGYVQYALEYPLKDRVICTDFSRRKIKYKDEEGKLIDDPEMVKLSQKLFQAIEEKNAILVSEYTKELYDKYNISMMEPNNEMENIESEHFYVNLELVTEELMKIRNQKREVDEIAKGNKNEIYYEFIKDICSKTT